MEMFTLYFDTFSAGESHGFDHYLVVYLLHVSFSILRVAERGESEISVDLVLVDELSHECLGCLDPCGGLSGCGALHTDLLQRIDESGSERGLGSDVRKFDAAFLGEIADLVHIGLLDQCVFLRPLDDPGVGVLHHRVDLGTGPVQCLNGCVFTSSSTDCKYLHHNHSNSNSLMISSMPMSFFTLVLNIFLLPPVSFS